MDRDRLGTLATEGMEALMQSRKAIFTLIVVVFVLSQFSFISERFILSNKSQAVEAKDSTETHENPARQLIISIKEATQRVSGASESFNRLDEISDEEREAWNRENPCLSREELIPMYDKRKHAKKLPANPLWDELLTEYSKLHRACTRKVGDLATYFLTGNVSTGCQFVIANVGPKGGLGNRFLALVSSVLYAVVTKRVILMVSSTLVGHSTCEPFPGSSWLLDPNRFPVVYFHSDLKNASWMYEVDFFKLIDENINQNSSEQPPIWEHVNAVRELSEEIQPWGRFYCSAEQKFYSQVTWVYFSSYFFTIPRLFSAPPFRPTLEALFPDKMAATRLFRSLFLPSDLIWHRVLSIHHAYFVGGDRTVGIQLRYGAGYDQYLQLNNLLNDRIVDCTQRNGILPNVTEPSHATHPGQSAGRQSQTDSETPPNPVIKVFIACLFPGLSEHLSKRFSQGYTETGEDVALIQISNNHFQVFDNILEDEQAFAEVLLLSLSDQLLVTAGSTFGSLAQAYGALTPWFLIVHDADKQLDAQSCVKSSTPGVCNMATDTLYRCAYEPELFEKPITDFVPYMVDCVEQPGTYGLQMITEFHD